MAQELGDRGGFFGVGEGRGLSSALRKSLRAGVLIEESVLFT